MFLENLVVDAAQPQRLGRFWAEALGATTITDEPYLLEARLEASEEAYLDLCFPQVPQTPREPVRLHLDLAGGAEQEHIAERLRGLGARDLDIGQGDVPWIVLADVEGNAFCVMEHRPEYTHTGPIAGLPLDSADPERDAAFWSRLSGWKRMDDGKVPSLRHPSGRGPLLELCPEPEPKGEAKNRMHLDIRLEAADDPDEVATRIADGGGRELHPDWGELPWRVFADPSGNEFCVLPAS